MKIKDIDNSMYPSKIANHIVKEQNKEIERLNNIIDDLEKDLKQEIEKRDNIIDKIFEWMQNKYDNSDLTGFTVSFQELEDLKKLKEGK